MYYSCLSIEKTGSPCRFWITSRQCITGGRLASTRVGPLYDNGQRAKTLADAAPCLPSIASFGRAQAACDNAGPDTSQRNKMNEARTAALAAVTILVLAALAWSGVEPYERTTWALEVFPVLVVLPLLIVSYRRFPLTSVLYACIAAHALVLILGGAYTYARVPLGFELAEWFELARNPYDKIGHFFQGFVPALAAREILIRRRQVAGRRMLAFLVVCVALAISATYELVEWLAALLLGQGADEFLGTQGDPWDTQSDMAMALLGALSALLLLSRLHDRQIARLPASPAER